MITRHDVMLEFGRIASCFRKRNSHVDASYCPPFVRRCSKDRYGKHGIKILHSYGHADHEEVFPEYAYGFKYPEKNGNVNGAESWSIRLTAVYHQYCVNERRSVWILLNPRPQKHAMACLQTKQYLRGLSTPADCLQPHHALDELLISSHLRAWRQCLREYEDELLQLVSLIASLDNFKPRSIANDLPSPRGP